LQKRTYPEYMAELLVAQLNKNNAPGFPSFCSLRH
jgi:hypothetical protein